MLGRLFAGSLVMGLGSVVMLVAASLITQQEANIDEGFLAAIVGALSDNRVLGVLLLFVGGFIVGLPVAAGVSPPLPQVKIARTYPNDAKKHQLPSREGHLMTHSNGFWHLFDRNNELLSIPDEQVLEVRMVREDPARRPGPWAILWKRWGQS